MKRLMFKIEGNDGSGKSTLINALKLYFGDRAVYGYEPDDTARKHLFRASNINRDDLWKATHMSESRVRTIKKIVEENIRVHISDRWAASMMAYQYGHGNSDGVNNAIEFASSCGYEKLDSDDKIIYIYLNIPTEDAHARKTLQSEDAKNPYDKFPFEWYKEAEDNYKEYLNSKVYATEGAYCDVSVHFIDATKCKEDVFNSVKTIIESIMLNNGVI